MDVVLSGIRSTGHLHLGNYFGALKNFVRIQDTHKCFFFIADLHSLTTHPKPENARKDGSGNTSSRFLEDGSFFRLRNVTLAYNLPKNVLQKIWMSDLRIFVSADNVLTLTRFSGMDPEVRLDADTYHHAGMYTQNYPIPMTITAGIDIKF